MARAGIGLHQRVHILKIKNVAVVYPTLTRLVTRGWAHLEAGNYTILQAGIDAISSFYAISLRVLDRGQKLLDVGLFLSIMKKAEESMP